MTVRKRLLAPILLVILLLGSVITVHAEEDVSLSYSGNPYDAVIVDDCGTGSEFFSAEDEEELVELMKPITEYTNILLIGTYEHSYSSTQNYAQHQLQSRFGSEPAVAFVVDMDLRKIFICSTGSAQKTITDTKAEQICDKVYIYATESYNRDFARSAKGAMEQILIAVKGGRITSPMKIICNILLAFVLALLINYFIAMFSSRSKKPSSSLLLNSIYKQVLVNNAGVAFTHQTKQYSPQSSGSGGSSGGGSSGGGGGGGGSSGGGHSI